MLVCCIFRPLFFKLLVQRGGSGNGENAGVVESSRHVIGVLFGFGLDSENDCVFYLICGFAIWVFWGVFPVR